MFIFFLKKSYRKNYLVVFNLGWYKFIDCDYIKNWFKFKVMFVSEKKILLCNYINIIYSILCLRVIKKFIMRNGCKILFFLR